MKVKDLKVNDYFKTFSGEVFQIISAPKNKRAILQVRTKKTYTEDEFSDLLIEKVEKKE